MISMIVLRPCLNVISVWKPGISHYYVYYHLVYLMATNSFPRDFGSH